ncbi:MAG: hypothetical protein ACJAX3_002789 [Patiriisocius sp.]|jgi:hypothetical protein
MGKPKKIEQNRNRDYIDFMMRIKVAAVLFGLFLFIYYLSTKAV